MSEFDVLVKREDSGCLKYDGRAEKFGVADVVPLWVADHDFGAPPAMVEALTRRAQHPAYGYEGIPESLYDAQIQWLHKRYGWQVEREWIVVCPSVNPSLRAALLELTEPGAGVVVQPPVYSALEDIVVNSGRVPIHNELLQTKDRYEIDFEQLRSCAGAASMLFLCSPHNPVGRVWEPRELEELLSIAADNELVIVSDEVHADLVYPGERHYPLGLIAGDDVPSVTALAPSKAFGVMGLGLSSVIIAEPRLRAAVVSRLETQDFRPVSPFSTVAFETAYRECESWLDSMMSYLDETRQWVLAYMEEQVPEIRVLTPQACYLLWLDCRSLHLDDEQLGHFFVHKAGLGLSPGREFGPGGSGFMRMNIASPRSVIVDACERIGQALQSRS